MPTKRGQPPETPPDLPPEKAHAVLKAQLQRLLTLKGRNHEEASADEKEWFHLTEKLFLRSFGSGSPNLRNLRHAELAGEHFSVMSFDGYSRVDEGLYQGNFEARLQAYEGVMKSSLEELEIDLPDAGIKGVYEPGQEFEFYLDVKAIVGLAKQGLFVIDPYLSREIFDTYASAIPRCVRFRLLGSKVSPDLLAHAQKYASGGNFEFRSSNSIHDRVIFADNRVWFCGQSIKDAAKKKPTYIVEHDEAPTRPAYEAIWAAAQKLI